ncbi:hypothetical protein K432DRAFT_427169 [Lepidopterella palustris CBS 459.81]|uniref:Uncharacterized protein n=1 Tax=Lepidopterella palustris CBS 459.81 TaxID=1314670 RepID=A0A8E2JDN5_9PEZI|nr:hypothetical protein K432DRAFT_427169 [Lepidopterella palustris CBS 459.81]
MAATVDMLKEIDQQAVGARRAWRAGLKARKEKAAEDEGDEEGEDQQQKKDILDLFTLTVIEDREHLDGASTAAIRERFWKWCMTAPQSEQQQGDDQGSEIGPGLSPRYRYAIQVDATSLHSVVYDAPAPPNLDTTKRGWVKLIDASWQPVSSERIRDFFEPIQGVTQNNVGWMKIPYHHIDEYYVHCRDLNYWVTSYRRPPAVMGYPYDD